MTQQLAAKAATVLMWTGPELDQEREVCIPGLMLWKTKAIEHWSREGVLDAAGNISPKAPEAIIEKYSDEHGVLWLPSDIGQQPGICYVEPGLVALSGHLSFLGPMKLCWSHVAGLTAMAQPRLQPAQMLPGVG